ncbi:hypothetical protein D1872_300540 [compost metagenome]
MHGNLPALQVGHRYQDAFDMNKLIQYIEFGDFPHFRLGKGQEVGNDIRCAIQLFQSHT